MPMKFPEIRQSLLEANPEFRRLAEEHLRCEEQLEKIHDDPYLNSEELIQESVLKKKKLQLKDQMEVIIARHQQQLHSAARH
jgi:uncharacterized protein YdcH (DUF465 family)